MYGERLSLNLLEQLFHLYFLSSLAALTLNVVIPGS